MKLSFAIVTLIVAFSVLSWAEEDWRPSPTTKAPTTHAPTTHAPTTHAPTPSHGHGGGPKPRPIIPTWEPKYTPYELKNINVTKTLYNGLLFPNAINIVKAGQYPSGIFGDNVAGRITPVGEFTDQEGTFEYFYGLASGVDMISATFPKLIARDNIVAFQVTLLINQSAIGAQGFQNLTQEGFITFDNNSLIVSYDLAILRLGQANVIPNIPAVHQEIIDSICVVAQNYCVGNLTQYASYEACVTELNTVNFGTEDNLQSNTTCCRSLHAFLVPFRPWFHCPHVGPTGGDACIDVPYSEYYQESF